MTGIYSPTPDTSATLYANVMNYRWTKDTTSYISAQQTSTATKPATAVFATLRTLLVYAERPRVYVSYTLHDEDGSFYTDTPQEALISVAGVSRSGNCGTTRLAKIAKRHVDSCLLILEGSDFSSVDIERSVTVTVTPTSGAAPISVHAGNVTLKASPNWCVLSQAPPSPNRCERDADPISLVGMRAPPASGVPLQGSAHRRRLM